MPLIEYTAVDRDELADEHVAAGTYALHVQFEGFPRSLVAKASRDETLDGTPESYLHALQRQWAIQTELVLADYRALWREFFSSVLNAETFSVDFGAQPQAVQNPGFEQGDTTGWTDIGSGGAVSSSYPHFGGYAFRVPADGTDRGVYQQLAAQEGDVFVLSAFGGRDEASLPDGAGRIQVVDSMANANQVDLDESVSGWQEAEMSLTCAAGTTYIRISCRTPGASSGAWYFDDFRLTKLSADGYRSVWMPTTEVLETQEGSAGSKYGFTVKAVP